MRVFIDDKGRFKQNSGYGNLSRNYIMSLKKVGCEIYLADRFSAWEKNIEQVKKEMVLEGTKDFAGNFEEVDIVFTISTPKKRVCHNTPNVLYTQNALGGLKEEWAAYISEYDSVIVPGEFDLNYFSHFNKNIFTCPQLIDNKSFKKRDKWRAEGDELFTFIYIGSLSYRKGVDILLESFCKYSIKVANNVVLKLFCPGAKDINFLLETVREFNPAAKVLLYTENYSQAWMSRHINRSDVFITLSRGEGWCMPLFESLLCEIPAIVPNSTAMGECSPDYSVIKIPVVDRLISDIDSSFASGFKADYGEESFVSYDVEVEDVIATFDKVRLNYQQLKSDVKDSKDYILKNYNEEKIGMKLHEIFKETLILSEK